MVQFNYVSLPYAGKPTGTDKYYVNSSDKFTEYLVNTTIELGGKDSVKGQNISLNCYFTSMVIVEWRLEKNITITGTLKSTWKGLPKEMKEAAPKDGPACESKSTKWSYNGKKVLISYEDEKIGTKIVLALATMFDMMHVLKGQRKNEVMDTECQLLPTRYSENQCQNPP